MEIVARLAGLLVPPVCTSCRAPVGGGDPLCASCRRRLPWLLDPCRRCGTPGHGSRCVRPPADLARVWAPLAYEGPARDVVLALKYRGALPLAAVMAAQIAANLPVELRSAGAVLVPVPPHPARRRARGFDPVSRVSEAVAARTGMDVACCLVRRDAARRQVGTGRAQRLRSGRLDVRTSAPVPRRVLLLDDVITTGATLSACADVLRAAGASWVAGVAYARSL